MVMTYDTGHWKIATRAKRSRNIHHIYALDNSIKILKYPRWQTIRMGCEDYHTWILSLYCQLWEVSLSTFQFPRD